MSAINIPLFELGKSNRNLYDICQLVLKAKDIKSMTSEVVIAGGACLVELFTFSPTLTLKYTTQLKTAIGTSPNTRQTSFQFNNKTGRYDPYEYIPRYFADALNSYITVCSPKYHDLNKKYGLPENETYRTSINSAADLLTTIAKLCNILLPLCKRKKVDCFHIQNTLKIIYLANTQALEQLLIKTINSTAKLLVNDATLANTIKTDPMISKTVATFNSVLTGGITITNEAAVYLSLFMLSLNPDIAEPDKLITMSTKKTVSKKKKSPSATPSSTSANPITESPTATTTSDDLANVQKKEVSIQQDSAYSAETISSTDSNIGTTGNLSAPDQQVIQQPKKLSFKLKA